MFLKLSIFLFEQISDQNYFLETFCVKGTQNKSFHHNFFLHDEKTGKNLSFICRLCQARQMAETKIWWDTKYPIKRPDSAKNNFSVFKIVNFKNTEICLNKFQTKIYFGNVLCKGTQNKSFHHKFFSSWWKD